MQLEQNLVFIGCTRYDFKPDNGGDNIKACKVFAVNHAESLKGHDQHGLAVSEVKAPYEIFAKLEQLTPLKSYSFILEVSVGKKVTVSVLDVVTK